MADEQERFILSFETRNLDQVAAQVQRVLGQVAKSTESLGQSGTVDLGLGQVVRDLEDYGRSIEALNRAQTRLMRDLPDQRRQQAGSLPVIDRTQALREARDRARSIAQEAERAQRIFYEQAKIPFPKKGQDLPNVSNMIDPSTGTSMPITGFMNQSELQQAQASVARHVANSSAALQRAESAFGREFDRIGKSIAKGVKEIADARREVETWARDTAVAARNVQNFRGASYAPTYNRPDLSTPIGRAQGAINSIDADIKEKLGARANLDPTEANSAQKRLKLEEDLTNLFARRKAQQQRIAEIEQSEANANRAQQRDRSTAADLVGSTSYDRSSKVGQAQERLDRAVNARSLAENRVATEVEKYGQETAAAAEQLRLRRAAVDKAEADLRNARRAERDAINEDAIRRREQQREQQRAWENERQFSLARYAPQYASPDLTTPIGQSQSRINDIDDSYRRALHALNSLDPSSDGSAEKRVQLERDLSNLFDRRTAEQKRIAALEQAEVDAVGRRIENERLFNEASYKPAYASPDLRTPVGRSQAKLNDLQYAIANAQHSLSSLSPQEEGSARQRTDLSKRLADLVNQRVAAQSRLAEAERNEAAASQGGIAGTWGAFRTGFRGNQEVPVAQQLGQTARFSMYYGATYKALFALTQTLQASLQEGIEFQQALTEMKLASGRSAKDLNDLSDAIGSEAVQAGVAPSDAIRIGARSLGLFGASGISGASAAEQDRIASLSARIISRMSVGSERPIEDLQNDISAVAKAFQSGASGQVRVYDLDAYMSKAFGIEQGRTLEAVAQSASVGQAAGFSQEEINALAAALMSGTGQTSGTVGGFLAQIFSRGGEGSLENVSAKYGIDTNLVLADQIRELAKLYRTADENMQTNIATSFGRGKVQNAAQLMLQNFDQIEGAARQARAGATGMGDMAYEERMNNLGGQITQTIGEMKAFVSQLAQSGALDILGLGLQMFRELVEAGTNILDAWNEIPGVVKSVIASLGLLALAGRTMRGSGFIGGLLGHSGGEHVLGRGEHAMEAGLLGSLKFSGALTAATLGLTVFNEVISRSAQGTEALNSIRSARDNASDEELSTPDGMRARADALAQEASKARETYGGFFGGLLGNTLFRGRSDRLDGNAAFAEDQARRLQAAADRIEAREAERASRAPSLADTNWDADGLAESMQRITDNGGTARDRLAFLSEVISNLGEEGSKAAARIDAQAFADQESPRLLQEILGASGDAFAAGNNKFAGGPFGTPVDPIFGGRSADTTGDAISQYLMKGVLEGRLREQLDAVGGNWRDLTKEEIQGIANNIIQDDFSTPGVTSDQASAIRDVFRDQIVKFLVNKAQEYQKATDLSAAEMRQPFVSALMDELQGNLSTALDRLPENDLRSRIELQQSKIAEATKARDDANAAAQDRYDAIQKQMRQVRRGMRSDIDVTLRTGGDRDDLDARVAEAKQRLAALRGTLDSPETESGWDSASEEQLQDMRMALGRDLVAEMDELRKVAQQRAKSKAEAKAIFLQAVPEQVSVALMTGDTDLLANIVSQAGKAGLAVVKQQVEMTLKAVQAAQAMRMLFAVTMPQMLATIPDMSGQVETYQGMLDMLNNTAVVKGDSALTGSDAWGSPATKDKGAKKDPEEARKKMLDLKNTLYLLSIDITDPLAQAVAAVKDARRRLASARSAGRPRDEIAEAQLNVKQAQAEREATAFQQRLSAVQTAEQLGRISHAKYIQYLESESKRLNNIKDRTYQQQQQLDQVDTLLQEASKTMEGMWNFGDINLPTPYQVRRYIKQHDVRPRELTSVGGDNNISNIFQINGADVAKVRDIVVEVVGRSGRTMTTAPRRM